MDIELVQQIVDYIRKLAEPIVTAGFDLVLRQVQYIMWRDIFINVVAIAVFVTGIVVIKQEHGSDMDWEGAGFTVGGLMLLISLIVFCANMAAILNVLINPQWAAIELITSLIN